MDISSESPLCSFLSRLLLVGLSFADDAALLALSRMGLHLQWLQWLSPMMMGLTVGFWGVRFMRYCFDR